MNVSGDPGFFYQTDGNLAHVSLDGQGHMINVLKNIING